MAYQAPNYSNAILQGLQGAKTLAELDKLRAEGETAAGLRDAFAPIKSSTPQTTEIGGSTVNLGTTSRAPTKDEALAKARMVDPEKAALIEQYMSKSEHLSAETKKLEIQAKEAASLSQFSKLVHGIDAYENTKDVDVFKNVLKQYDPNDDTTGIQNGPKKGQYIITSAKNPKGILVDKKQLMDAAIPLLDKYKEEHQDSRYYANLDRLFAKDEATKAAKQKSAKEATPGQVQQMARTLKREFDQNPEYSGFKPEDIEAMAVDAEGYINQLIKDFPDMTPMQREAEAMNMLMSRITKAQKSGLFGVLPDFTDIGKPNVPAKYTKGEASTKAETEANSKQEAKGVPLPKGLTEEDVKYNMDKYGYTRKQVIDKYNKTK